MLPSAAVATHFLCQPIRPMWSRSSFLAPRGLLLRRSWSSSTQSPLDSAEVTSGPDSDTLTYLWKLFERSNTAHRRAAIMLQIGRTQGSMPLLEKLASLRLGEEETLALIEALSHQADPRQLPLLQSLYKRFWDQPRYQQEIILAAGRTQSEQGLAFLREIYTSAWHRLEYRQSVIRALGFQASAEAVAMLVEISRQYAPELKIQRAIIRALGYSHSAASAHVLKDLLSRYPQLDMRQLTYRALAATASDTAVEILRSCLKQAKGEERQVLESALKRAYREDAV
jgi:hypothetical protein